MIAVVKRHTIHDADYENAGSDGAPFGSLGALAALALLSQHVDYLFSQGQSMNPYVKKQNELRTEIADLANSHSILRNHYMQNSNADLLEAMERIVNRMLDAEKELDAAADAEGLNSAIPSISIKTTKRMKI